jgi:hypothetical protein
VVRDHLHQRRAPVYYVENALINSLFGLLCWDAVFSRSQAPSSIPTTAARPICTAPISASAAAAVRGRAVAAGRRRTAPPSGQLRAKAGIQSPFVYWEALDQELLELALDCIPPLHLRALSSAS